MTEMYTIHTPYLKNLVPFLTQAEIWSAWSSVRNPFSTCIWNRGMLLILYFNFSLFKNRGIFLPCAKTVETAVFSTEKNRKDWSQAYYRLVRHTWFGRQIWSIVYIVFQLSTKKGKPKSRHVKSARPNQPYYAFWQKK